MVQKFKQEKVTEKIRTQGRVTERARVGETDKADVIAYLISFKPFRRNICVPTGRRFVEHEQICDKYRSLKSRTEYSTRQPLFQTTVLRVPFQFYGKRSQISEEVLL